MEKKVLIIDDNRMSREILEITLKDALIDAVSASNGNEALEILENGAYDLIILDLILPGLDGYSLLTMLKANPKTMRIPVIILSSRDSKEEKAEAIKLGAACYMVKHLVHPTEVLKTVKMYLRDEK
jgi:two-component system, cell cycle response regulator